MPLTARQQQYYEAIVKNNGSPRAAARELGMTHPALVTFKTKHPELFEPRIAIPEPPPSESVQDILAYKEKIFKAKKSAKDHYKLINVAVNHSGAICLAGIGDPHIDDDGCDIAALKSDLAIIKRTPAMYAGHVGDLTNNWTGRLARLYANQVTTGQQAVALIEWMLNEAPNLFVINGNHDMWNQGSDIIKFIMSGMNSVNQAHGARIALNFQNGKQIRIHARHDFKGYSQYNPTHGHRKEQLWGGNRDHIYISGHRHVDGASLMPHPDGSCSWSFIVSGYKVIDDYADEHGFHEQRMSSSIGLVIDPNAKVQAEIVKPFWDLEAAADYLTFIRAKK